MRNQAGMAVVLCVLLLAACTGEPDPATLARGARAYAAHCASCHGEKLEGQPGWKEKLPSGKWRAPALDNSGHAWQHSDRWLFHVVENGPASALRKPVYESDMPGFGDKISDAEIRAVLVYIKSHWSEETKKKREQRPRRRSISETLNEHLRR